MAHIAIFGIGNVLLGDDGVGPAVAHFLEANYDFGDDVVVEDLGTPSLDLPDDLVSNDAVIFVDAVATDQAPGTLSALSPACGEERVAPIRFAQGRLRAG